MSISPTGTIGELYDIVIVGAGPAGCCLARYLSDKFKILIIDRSDFPRNKPCGGLLVDETQEFIKQLEPLGFIFSNPKRLDLKLIDWDNGSEIDLKRGYINVLRDKFDYWMLQLVEKNVDFLPKTELVDIIDKGGSLNLAINKDSRTHIIKTKYLIGADGASSTVRHHLSSKKMRAYVAIQEYVDNKGPVDGHTFFIYDNSVTDFYSWLIPKGDSLQIGAALPMANGNVRDLFLKLRKKVEKNLDIGGSVVGERESALILRPSSAGDINLGTKNILLVGEAAGLISPSTGEGISFALRSGYACANALNGGKDVAGAYTRGCSDLIRDIKEKAVKADALSDPAKRLSVFERWSSLSEDSSKDESLKLWSK